MFVPSLDGQRIGALTSCKSFRPAPLTTVILVPTRRVPVTSMVRGRSEVILAASAPGRQVAQTARARPRPLLIPGTPTRCRSVTPSLCTTTMTRAFTIRKTFSMSQSCNPHPGFNLECQGEKSNSPVKVSSFIIDSFFFIRDLTLEVLSREPEGAFVVRESNSRNSGLALSVRVPLDFHPGGIAHYLIVRAPKGFRIKVRINCFFNQH